MRMSATPVSVPTVAHVEGLFKGFADPTRVRILNLLSAGELCVCDLVALLRLSQPTVSRHLAYLRRAGLVVARPDLRFTYYRLSEPGDPVHQRLVACVHTCFDGIPSLEQERKAAIARVTARRKSPCR
jgi:ArsR family transcriptional regulator